MIKQILLAFILISLISACSKNESDSDRTERVSISVDADLEARAKAAVSNNLKDPGSAQFRNMRQIKPGQFCGEVNAKNVMGGYVGFKTFYWTISAPNDADILSDTSTLCK